MDKKKSLSILLIDDLLDFSLVTKRYLEKLGHTVTMAKSFFEAKEKLENSYNIILLDYMLPDGSGIDLLKIIKAKYPLAAVIVITASNDKEVIVNFMNSGAFAYLEKPLDYTRLESLLKRGFDYMNLTSKNLELTQEILRKNEAIHKLSLAKDLQKKFLKNNYITRNNLSVRFINKESLKISGNFYDVIELDSKTLVVVLGEIGGSGINSAIGVISILTIIRTLFQLKMRFSSIMDELNNMIYSLAEGERVVSTCFIGKIDLDTYELQYINAGHEYPIILNSQGELFKRVLKKNDLFLGAISDYSYDLQRINLKYGDRFFITSKNIKCLEKLSENKIPSNIFEMLKEEVELNDTTEDKTIMEIEIFKNYNLNKKFHRRFNSNDLDLENSMCAIRDVLTNINIDETTRFDLEFSIMEILKNSVQHAYLEKTGLIDLKMQIVDSTLTITIRDYGIGINFSKNKADISSRGRGYLIVEKAMDEVIVNKKESGVEVVLIKRIKSCD